MRVPIFAFVTSLVLLGATGVYGNTPSLTKNDFASGGYQTLSTQRGTQPTTPSPSVTIDPLRLKAASLRRRRAGAPDVAPVVQLALLNGTQMPTLTGPGINIAFLDNGAVNNGQMKAVDVYINGVNMTHNIHSGIRSTGLAIRSSAVGILRPGIRSPQHNPKPLVASSCGWWNSGRGQCFAGLPYGCGAVTAQIITQHIDNSINPSDIITVFPYSSPQCHVNPPCNPCESAGLPVDLVTGKLWYKRDDLVLSGPFGLTFSRYYDNQSNFNTTMGFGWHSSYSQYLDLSNWNPNSDPVDNQIAFYSDQGAPEYFPVVLAVGPTKAVYYDNLSGDHLIVNALNTSPVFTVQTWQNTSYNFDINGVLLSIADRFGNTQTVNRDVNHNNRISSVTDQLSRSMTFAYQDGIHISSVTSYSSSNNVGGVTVSYNYDPNTGDLLGVKTPDQQPNGHKWQYTYDSNHNLQSVIDPSGNYEEQNTFLLGSAGTYQVQTQFVSTVGGVQTHHLSFNFGNPGVVVITDGDNGTTTDYIDSNKWRVITRTGPLCDCGGYQTINLVYDQFSRLKQVDQGGTKSTYYAYGEDVYFPDGTDIATAFPAVTTESQGGTGATLLVKNLTYGTAGSNIQDLVKISTVPSVANPLPAASPFTVTNTYYANGTLKSQTKSGLTSVGSGLQPVSYVTNYGYNGFGQVTSITGPSAGQATTFQYFSSGDLASLGQLQSMSLAVTPSQYNVSQLTWLFAPAGFGVYSGYDVYGNARSIEDPNGTVNEATYESAGRQVASIFVGTVNGVVNPTTSYAFDPLGSGRLMSVTRPLGNAAAFAYDAASRLNSMTLVDSGGVSRQQLQIALDPMDHVTVESAWQCQQAGACSSWAMAQQKTFQYTDPINQNYNQKLISITHSMPNSNLATYKFQYDGNWNLNTTTSESGVSSFKTYGYDGLTRLVQLGNIDGSGSGEALQYDNQDNNQSANDGVDTNSYTSDDFGRSLSATSNNGGTTYYQYDASNNILSSVDPNDATTVFTYDSLNRILSSVSTNQARTITETISWSYDGPGCNCLGRLTSMMDLTGTSRYAYNKQGLLNSQTLINSKGTYSNAYAWDANRNRLQITYPSGRIVKYTYDYADRPLSVYSGSTNYVTSAVYEPFGPLQTLVYGNSTKRNITYDLSYEPVENKLTHSTTTLADFTYGFDPDGDITSVLDTLHPPQGQQTLGAYDKIFSYNNSQDDSLMTPDSGASLWGLSSTNQYIQQYGYGNMNVTQIPHGAANQVWVNFDNNPRGLNSQATSYGDSPTQNRLPILYDNAGNESSFTTPTTTITYTYSPRNLLATDSSGYSYTYNGFGVRNITATSAGSRYSFYGPDLNLIEETNITSGTPAAAYDYIWFGGLPVAQEDMPTPGNLTSVTHWTFSDHQGAPIIQTDSNQQIYWQADYYPSGEIFALRTGTGVHQPLRYPGQEAEQLATNNPNGDTGRFYNFARWYRPHLQRYTQPDPFGVLGSLSPYQFAYNNPISFSDQSGVCPVCAVLIAAAVGGAVGAVVGGVVGGVGALIISHGDSKAALAGAAGGAVSGAIVGSGADLIMGLLGVGAVGVAAVGTGAAAGGARSALTFVGANALLGAAGSAAGSAAQQVTANRENDQSWDCSFSNINTSKVLYAAGVGGVLGSVAGMNMANLNSARADINQAADVMGSQRYGWQYSTTVAPQNLQSAVQNYGDLAVNSALYNSLIAPAVEQTAGAQWRW
jgi:RHS repeat-associated protein